MTSNKNLEYFFHEYENIISNGLEYNHSEKEIYDAIYSKEFNKYLRKGIHPRLDELSYVVNFVREFRSGELDYDAKFNPNHDPETGRFTSGSRISSTYGLRKHPKIGKIHFHTGDDHVRPRGTKIPSTGDGEVLVSGYGKPGSGFNNFGHYVAVIHNDGKLRLYAHLDKPSHLKQGDKVNQGDLIGHVGSSGATSTGNHLHYEVRTHFDSKTGYSRPDSHEKPSDEETQYLENNM